MSELPLHPLAVHLPLALAVLMPFLSAGLVLAWHRAWLPRRAFVIVVALQLVLVASGVAAMKTGERDEDLAERIVAKSAIHEHEEAAEAFVYSAAALALLFVAVAALKDRPAAKILATVATVASVGVLGLGLRAGHAGGRLVYELGAASAHVEANARGR